jgi:hypothetical protein
MLASHLAEHRTARLNGVPVMGAVGRPDRYPAATIGP